MSSPPSLSEPASQFELRHLELRLETVEKRLREISAEKAEQARLANERFFRRVNLASAFGLGFFAATMLGAALG